MVSCKRNCWVFLVKTHMRNTYIQIKTEENNKHEMNLLLYLL